MTLSDYIVLQYLHSWVKHHKPTGARVINLIQPQRDKNSSNNNHLDFSLRHLTLHSRQVAPKSQRTRLAGLSCLSAPRRLLIATQRKTDFTYCFLRTDCVFYIYFVSLFTLIKNSTFILRLIQCSVYQLGNTKQMILRQSF